MKMNIKQSCLAALTILLVQLVSTTNLPGQQDFCETEPPQTILMQSGGGTQFDIGPMIVRVYVHVIRRSNGTGGLSAAEVTNSLDILTQDFAAGDVCFSLLGQDFIDDDYYYNFTRSRFNALVNVGSHANAVDIYLLPYGVAFGGRANGIPGTALAIEGSLSQTSVISHEMGHCLGLYHTHSGRGCNDFANCAEAVDGSNCVECGDLVCDTPADPCLSGSVSAPPACAYTGPPPFTPLTENIMSYTLPGCMTSLTNGQFVRLLDITENHNDVIIVPHNITISNMTLSGNPLLYAVNESITAHTNVIVANTASVELEAGEKIRLQDGFTAQQGSRLHAHIQDVCNVVDRDNSAKPSIDEPWTVSRGQTGEKALSVITGLRAYPNPFSDKTSIVFTLSEARHVSLMLYDTFGRKLQNLIQHRYMRAGDHSVALIPESIPAGAYMYVLTVGDTIDYGKLTLIK